MSTLYDIGRRGFLTEITVNGFTGQIDWESDDFRVALIDTVEYSVDEVSHTSMDDVPGAAIVADTALVSPVALSDGTASAANTVFSSVSGNTSSAVLIYRDNGTSEPEDNVLIAYIDSSISGLPVSPNGGDITVLWNGGDGKIFRL